MSSLNDFRRLVNQSRKVDIALLPLTTFKKSTGGFSPPSSGLFCTHFRIQCKKRTKKARKKLEKKKVEKELSEIKSKTTTRITQTRADSGVCTALFCGVSPLPLSFTTDGTRERVETRVVLLILFEGGVLLILFSLSLDRI